MIKVRKATVEDVEPTCEIAVEAWKPIYESYRRLLGDELFETLHKTWQEDKADEIRDHYKRYPDWMLVAVENRQVVGFATFLIDKGRKIGIISNNAVKPEHQRKGIGTLQYQKILEVFRMEKARFAKVTTGLDDAHAPARAAYEKVGFQRTITTVTYYMKIR